MFLGAVTHTSIVEIESMPASAFREYWEQLPWLIAMLKRHALEIVCYPVGGEEYRQEVDASIQDAFDPRDQETKWKEARQAMRN